MLIFRRLNFIGFIVLPNPNYEEGEKVGGGGMLDFGPKLPKQRNHILC
jgi:hypothetical protein